MQKYQHFIWFLIAAVLQANVAIATSEMAASSDNPCEGWQLKKKAETSATAAENLEKPNEILMDLALKFAQGKSVDEADLPDKLQKYFQEYSSTFAPSFLLFVILALALLPVWCMCGCTEGCWFKTCRPDHANMVVPCIYWIIWVVSVVVLAAVVIAAQTSFQRFSNGISQTVCDVDGSMGETANYVDGISSKVDGLATEIGTIIDEGQDDVTSTINQLQSTINTANKSLSDVLGNIMDATDIIVTSFKDYDIDFTIPGFDNLKQQANLDSQVNFDDIKSQLANAVTTAKGAATELPKSFTYTLKNISYSIRMTRQDTFSSGQINVPDIPVLFPGGLQQATLIEATGQGTGALQQLVLLMYIPVFLCAPPLLLGGALIMAFFCFCRDNKCYKGAVCGSKFGCCLLHVGLFFILILSMPFLGLALVYNDTCVIGNDPVVALDYFQKQGSLTSLTSMIPANNFTEGMEFLATATQCFAGSGYSGTDTLASRLGLSDLIDTAIQSADSQFAQADTIDIGKFVDEAFGKAKTEINSFQSQADGQKMPQSLINEADTSCTQCANFKQTFQSFSQKYNGEDMQSYGDSCDDVCSSSPAEGCASYSTTTTNAPGQAVPPLTVVNGKITLPNGQQISVPSEIADKINGGENDPGAPCRMCKEKVCSLASLGGTINTQIDVIDGELTKLLKVVDDTQTSIKSIQDSMLQPIKDLFTKASAAIKKAMDTIDCAVVGDIWNTVYSSVCTNGSGGFTEYSWYFVWCGFFGTIVIITTILLNLCVGLRPLDDAGKERDLPDYPGIEMGNKGLGDAYVSSPGPQFTPAGDADVPTAVHVRSDDKGQYIM